MDDFSHKAAFEKAFDGLSPDLKNSMVEYYCDFTEKLIASSFPDGLPTGTIISPANEGEGDV
jgi:hypothetical protein